MVATRRPLVAPEPPASRPPSSQQTSSAGKGKAPRAGLDASETLDLLSSGESGSSSGRGVDSKPKGGNTDDNSNGKKNKTKGKKGGKKFKRDRSHGFVDLLTRILILFFTIYTLSVCPGDETPKSTVCRGLHEYRRLILDPLILPPIRLALAHPSVAPYVEQAKPHYYRAVGVIEPIVAQTQYQWNLRVVPQWNKRIIPQWNHYAVPQLQKLDNKIEPYRTRASQAYGTQVAPYVNFVTYNLDKWHHKAQPYVILAAVKTKDGYQTAKPYAIPVLRQVQLYLKQFAFFLQAQRREFVDPHVARLWEKVIELSSGKPKATVASAPSKASQSPYKSGAPVHASPIVPPPTDEPAISASPIIVESLHSSPNADESVSAPPIPPHVLGSITSNVYTASEPARASQSTAADPTETLKSASSVISASVHATASKASSMLSSESASPESESLDIDLDDFYAQLGLDDEEAVPEVIPDQEPIHEETEEEIAERKRKRDLETAEKRADITGRHTKWEQKLEEMANLKTKELRKSLVALRKQAAEELEKNVEIEKQMDSLVSESDKLLNGAEVFLKNLKKDKKNKEEKVKLWERVIGKIEVKFVDKVQETEGVVNEWYAEIEQTERQMVADAAQAVKSIADRGQEDIGMDYSWLDDVTVADWTRYHDLVKKSNNFTIQLQMIQNGTHPSPPINPIITALDKLETEVQDIIIGFETRFGRVKRDGGRTFGNGADGVTEDTQESSDPKILPIPEDDPTGESVAGSPVMIGRSKKEVVEAMERAAADALHPEHASERESKENPAHKTNTNSDFSTSRDRVEL